MNATTADKKARILHLTYDPKTQRGLVLRLQACLGQHFQLRFQSIGSNGGKSSFPIMDLPVEMVFYIISFLLNPNPTKQDIKTLFSLARSSPSIRILLEDPAMERMTSLQLLGASHSRNWEQRRLGLEPNVNKRYGVFRKETDDTEELRRGILGLLGLPHEPLQRMANRKCCDI